MKSKSRDARPQENARRAAANPTQDEVSECARRIWEKSGRPEGIDVPIWLEAEKRLRSGARLDGGASEAMADTRALVGEPSDSIEDRVGLGGDADARRSVTAL
ncbi:MAG TPA: DUF2934 domain-containing protein [Opitutaceae bacterium]|jgi:hypothetical protein